MQRPQNLSAQPIVPGYAYSATIPFLAVDGSAAPGVHNLTTVDQLLGAVRAAPNPLSPLLATPTVAAVSATKLSFSLLAADTAAMAGLSSVAIDFAYRVGTAWTPLPAVFVWPVVIFQ